MDGDVKLATCYFEKRRPLLYFLPFKNEEARELLASTQIWIKTFFTKLFKRMNRKVIYVILHNENVP